MNAQMILSPSGERLVVLSEADYVALVSAAEDAIDGKLVDAFRRDIAASLEELIPCEVVDRLLRGDNRVEVWREYRGMTMKALAEAAGIEESLVSRLEDGKQAVTVETLGEVAKALGITLEDLVAPDREASTHD